MGTLWKRIADTCLRRAADPLFSVKMRVNELVIGEVTRALHPDLNGSELTDAQNNVAVAMLESEIHDQINSLSRAVIDEIRKQRKTTSG